MSFFRFVLIKHGKVLDYASRSLKVDEGNYRTNDFELEVVVYSLKIWRNLLVLC